MRRMTIGAAAAVLWLGTAKGQDAPDTTLADAQQRLAERTATRKASETQPAETEVALLRKQLAALAKANKELRAEVERLRSEAAKDHAAHEVAKNGAGSPEPDPLVIAVPPTPEIKTGMTLAEAEKIADDKAELIGDDSEKGTTYVLFVENQSGFLRKKYIMTVKEMKIVRLRVETIVVKQ